MILLLLSFLSAPQSQPEFDFSNPNHWDGLGMRVFFLDDLNGDGILEFGSSAFCTDNNGTNSGSVYVYDGATQAILRTHDGASAKARLGEFADFVGDVDGDGFIDYAGGARNEDWGPINSGSAYVYSGADGSELHRFDGTQSGSAFGLCITGIPDIDGDGCDEVAVGAPEENTFLGKVYFYSGATGQLLGTVAGISPGGQFGLSMDAIDDVTGDGLADLIVGSPYANNEAGKVSLVDPTNLLIVGSYAGTNPGSRLGWQVANAGDTNRDGNSDILVGVPCNDTVYLATVAGTLIRKHKGAGGATKEGYGHSLSAAGDINQDGFDDYMLGHPGEWDGFRFVGPGGGAEIYSGLDGRVLASYTTLDLDDGFGSSIAYSSQPSSVQAGVLIGSPAGGDLLGGHAPGTVSGRHVP